MKLKKICKTIIPAAFVYLMCVELYHIFAGLPIKPIPVIGGLFSGIILGTSSALKLWLDS